MKDQLRTAARRLGLAGPLFRAYEHWLAAKWSLRYRSDLARVAPDGLPVPPPALIVLVGGDSGPAAFLGGGRALGRIIREMLARNGLQLEAMNAILDFGCGCGRVVRQWQDLPATRVYGTDLNRTLIDWCRANLPFAHFETNALVPPTRFPGAAFDFIYAFSVFTHMPETLQLQWMGELRRLLKPGGHLLISTEGASYLGLLTPAERERFTRGELIERYTEAAGANLCAAFHPEAYLRQTLARDFSVVEFAPGAATHDLSLLRRPA